MNQKEMIETGKTALGIEFGSTRIKAVLVGEDYAPLASGDHAWENRLENGLWTYSPEDIWSGLQTCYRRLTEEVQEKYGLPLKTVGAIGFSGMMHGYLAFDAAGELLVPFRTWRNTVTEDAARELSALFGFNIPQRWSIAHLYHAILAKEEHTPRIAFFTTLAGYVHWKLTGRKVLGVGEASGMFPIDSETGRFDAAMIEKFDACAARKGFTQPLSALLPEVLSAGEDAGALTGEGARLLDPTGVLSAGIPLCPPEGDAGTGMVATNAVAAKTGNVSAGTSIFAMAVLPKALSGVYPEIDMVTTPTGRPVAMVHCNTCTSDIDAWVRLFEGVLSEFGCETDKSDLYKRLYGAALSADADCGRLTAFNYYSGEPVTGLEDGRPLLVRMPDSRMTLPNFMRAQLFSAMATLRLGMDILFEKEKVELSRLCGHGGLFKTPVVGQRLMAGAMNTPVVVMETAGEGGAWGIALLAEFLRTKEDGETLEDFLQTKVFGEDQGTSVSPQKEDVDSFNDYMTRYKAAIAVEKAAVGALR